MQSNKKLLALLCGLALSAVPFMSQAQFYTSATSTAGCGIPTFSGPFPGTNSVLASNTGPGVLYVDNVPGPYFGFVFYLYGETTFPPSNESTTEPGGVTEFNAEEGIEADCGLSLGGVNDSYFGPNNTVLDVEFVRAPFDAGISLLLGAGVIAGIKRARARKEAAI